MGIGRKFVTFAAVVGVMVVGGGFATAAESGTHTVTYQVINTRTLSLSNTGTIAIGTIVKTDATGITASGGNVSYSTDSSSDRVTAAITTGGNPASGVTLSVSAGAPGTCTAGGAVGTNQSNVSLTTAEADVITAIDTPTGTCVSALTYKVVTSNATPAAEASKTLTYTIKAT